VDITDIDICLDDIKYCESLYSSATKFSRKNSELKNKDYWDNFPNRTLTDTYAVGWKRSEVWAKPDVYQTYLGITNHVHWIGKFLSSKGYTFDVKEKEFYEIGQRNIQRRDGNNHV